MQAVSGSRTAQALPRTQEDPVSRPRAPSETLNLHSLDDLAALASEKGATILKVQIENHLHLVRLEPGQIEFRPASGAPRTLAGDLAQKLREWTGTRWVVTVAAEGGAPTLAEQRKAAHAEKLERVAQQPMVRAVLDRFPGAEIVAVRDRAESDIPPSTEET
jgi:DNA polymerase-3 subunit gamma/tau